jgi:hypothetical protein
MLAQSWWINNNKMNKKKTYLAGPNSPRPPSLRVLYKKRANPK